MKISRIDLADIGSPTGLVTTILRLVPNLKPPIPIEDLALALDITAINELKTEGFEGGLLTDEGKREGIVLVNKAARGGRRRFTIGHELGHFLIPSHLPVEGRFLCSQKDLLQWNETETKRHQRMEAEANQFSGLMLMPPQLLRPYLAKRDPNLNHITDIARAFDVSKDAAARAYATFHQEAIAVVVTHNGIVRRYYPNKRFPFITAPLRKPVPNGSAYFRSGISMGGASGITQILPDYWIDVERGIPAPKMFEQVYHQAKGWALIMLWLEKRIEDEDFDPDAERTAKERFRDQQSRWS